MRRHIYLLSTATWLLAACNAGTGHQGTSDTTPAATRPDTVATTTTTPAPSQQDEDAQRQADCKAFLDGFYAHLDKDLTDAAYVERHITTKAKQYLKDAYDYDCEDDNCLATWLFAYDMTDPGTVAKRTIEAIGDDAYEVTTTYDRGEGETYVYAVRLRVVKDGDAYKIDSLEPRQGHTQGAAE